jgi:hypothetical protein
MTTEHKATIFALALLTTLAALIYYAATHSGPIVLGSERETDGQIEYLCLGRGCEDIQPAAGGMR